MSDTRRTNITVSETLYQKAQELMRLHDFTDFSGYIQHLIRADWDTKQIEIREERAHDLECLKAQLQYETDPAKRRELDAQLSRLNNPLSLNAANREPVHASLNPPSAVSYRKIHKPKRVSTKG